MYSTNIIINKEEIKQLRKEDLLSRLSEYDIFAKYVGPFKIGHVYNSPLRDDKNPSFGIFVNKRDGNLLYKDLSSGDCGDVFKFVKKLKGLTTYRDTLIEMSRDLNIDKLLPILNSKKKYIAKETIISVVRKGFNMHDMLFWNSFGITKDTLSLYQVNAISKCIVNGLVKSVYNSKSPMYSYKVFNKFKIYRPFDVKGKKWKGNLGNLDIQGFEQLPGEGELLIITKSLKDVMTLHELGYVAVAPASESTLIPDIVMDNLKKRFKNILVFYDRDKAGVQFARKTTNKFVLKGFFINKKYKLKDISDFVKANGQQSAIQMLEKEIN